MNHRLAPLFAVLLTACGSSSYAPADDLVACGDHCDAPPASESNATSDAAPAPPPVQVADGGPSAAVSPPKDGGADAADASVSDAAPDASVAPCACAFPSVHGGTVMKACHATACWKPANGATQYTLWLCVSNDVVESTFELCSSPE